MITFMACVLYTILTGKSDEEWKPVSVAIFKLLSMVEIFFGVLFGAMLISAIGAHG